MLNINNIHIFGTNIKYQTLQTCFCLNMDRTTHSVDKIYVQLFTK